MAMNSLFTILTLLRIVFHKIMAMSNTALLWLVCLSFIWFCQFVWSYNIFLSVCLMPHTLHISQSLALPLPGNCFLANSLHQCLCEGLCKPPPLVLKIPTICPFVLLFLLSHFAFLRICITKSLYEIFMRNLLSCWLLNLLWEFRITLVLFSTPSHFGPANMSCRHFI